MIDVYFPLPPHASARVYREVHPYGPATPMPGTLPFNADLMIAIDPSATPAHFKALAAVEGAIYCFPESSGSTSTLVLQPSPRAAFALNDSFDGFLYAGKASLAFVYRNLDTRSVRAAARALLTSNTQFYWSNDPPDTIADAFLRTEVPLYVGPGAELGAASPIFQGRPMLQFEIIFLPSGLLAPMNNIRFQERTKELLDPANHTRRLDPATFYGVLSNPAGLSSAKLADAHRGHVLFSVMTKRVLLEVRDAHDRPYGGVIEVSSGSAAPRALQLDEQSWGTAVLATAAQEVDYQLGADNRVITELPSGTEALETFAFTRSAPAHVAVQLLYLSAPTDDAPSQAESWFVKNADSLPNYTAKNKITAIRDGARKFRDADKMPDRERARTGYLPQAHAAMKTLSSSDHFFYLAAWSLSGAINFVPETAGTDFQTRVFQMGTANVRVLLWSLPLVDIQHMDAALTAIRLMPPPTGGFIADQSQPWPQGAFHQKILIINGSDGAYAFCGGIDLYRDRRDSPRHGAPAAFHDVHAKVEGPAVVDLFNTFVDRWNKHVPVSTEHTLNTAPLPTTPPPVQNAGNMYVQVARTYAAKMHYRYSPSGSTTCLQALIRAIGKAKKFFYMEDQYGHPFPGNDPDADPVGVLDALRTALTRPVDPLEYLILVIPNHSDHPQSRFRRKKFIKALKKVAPNKIHVFYLKKSEILKPGPEEVAATADQSGGNSGGPNYPDEIYCHAKVWIVDDIIAKIGSTNCCRRSYTHDAETDLIVLDEALLGGARRFARQLRIDLWSEHLNLTGASAALLEDYRLGLQYWLAVEAGNPPPGAHVAPYLEDVDSGNNRSDLAWDVVDPDGRVGM